MEQWIKGAVGSAAGLIFVVVTGAYADFPPIILILMFGFLWSVGGIIVIHRNAPEQVAARTAIKQHQSQAAQAERARLADQQERQRQEQLRAQQQRMFADTQTKMDDEAARGRLRSAVSELVDAVDLLGPEGDDAEVKRAINSVINDLASRQGEYSDRHFRDDMLQFDIRLILEKLEASSLKNDMVIPRLKKVLRQEASGAWRAA